MIRWLTGAHRKSRDWVTDDPLAAIAVPRPSLVYAVTRVNPIFIEDELKKKKSTCVFSGGKSGSSGYESQRSSSWSGEECAEESGGGLETGVRGVAATLTPIPEGRIDYCIPRPVWPRYEGRQRKAPAVRVDGRTLRRMRRGEKSPYDLLRELSTTINQAVDGKQVPAEEVLRDIGNKINSVLAPEEVAQKNEKRAAERALRRLSMSLGRREAVITVGRALSLSGSGSSDDAELEAGRLSLLRRLGRFPPVEPLYDLAQGSPSTSSSSSGFSDLTPTPPSSTSRPVFLHENPSSVPTRVRNAMMYDSLQSRPAGGYEKLRAERRIELDKQWTICEKEAGAEATASGLEKDVCVCPDFTLDGPQAEVLLRRLQSAKRQRFWCRLLVTTLGLVFFLFSVMAVSMMFTKSKRMFGSL